LVCEEEKVEIVCWGCKCEDFCLPGPSKPSCKHCKCVCAECDENGDKTAICTKPKRFIWVNWLPSYAKIYSRTKLMRKTVTVTVPSYRWVTEELCSRCAAVCNGIESNTESLPAPNSTGK
jgi:hypothetical protein